jgi:drug/metabolite transporter (DMT)-like permease
MIPSFTRFRVPETVRWGVVLALGTALISGVSIYANAFAVKQLPDPAVYTTIKNGVAAILLLAVLGLTVRPSTIRAVPARSWAWLLAIGVIGGSLAFLLFFNGLAQASAPSAAFIHKTLFVWVAILAVPLLGERLGAVQLAALGVLVAGQVLILTPANITWGRGETMIAAATLLWALETIIARRVLKAVPAQVVGAARLGIGLVVLVGYLGVSGKLQAVAVLTPEQWRWAILTGLLLSGYVATWFGALKRAPASLVTAVIVLGAPVTAALQAVQAGSIAIGPVVLGQLLVLVAGGSLALGAVARRSSAVSARVVAPAAAGTLG